MCDCPEGYKCCTKCGECKLETADYFYPKPNGRVGFRNKCRMCFLADANDYNHLPERKAWRKEYDYERRQSDEYKVWWREYSRTPRFRAYMRAYMRVWYPKNRTRCLSYPSHLEYLRNPDNKIRDAQRKKVRRQRPDFKPLRRKYNHSRRARLANLPNQWTEGDEQRMFEYWGNCCCICGKPPGLWHILALEHWIAVSDPRPDNPGNVAVNILPMCHTKRGAPTGESCCNNSKYNLDPIEWLVRKMGKRKAKRKLAEIEAYFEWVKQQSE